MSNGETLDLFKIPHFEIFSKISEEVHRFTIKFHKHRIIIILKTQIMKLKFKILELRLITIIMDNNKLSKM